MRMWLEKWFESALSAQTCCCIRDCWRFLMPCYTLRYTCAAARPMSKPVPVFLRVTPRPFTSVWRSSITGDGKNRQATL